MTLVQRSVGFGRGILFCRWLTPETLGQWEIVNSFLLLAAPLAVLGIPGSFGRYLEHYRQRGHLHTFLRRTVIWTLVCSVLAVGVVAWQASAFSYLLFSTGAHSPLVRGIAVCLAAIIMQHTLISLLNALRLFRVVSAVQFVHSLLFATLALALIVYRADVSSILIGYGLACLLSTVGGVLWVGPAIRDVDRPVDSLSQRSFWPVLMRFAFFIWLTNVLVHTFAIIDRYMLVHYSGMSEVEAQIQLGYYHSSRIVPLLLISFADLLSGLIMPHLSSDWEAGRRQQVGDQLRLSLKLAGLGMLAFGVCVMLFAPLLFDIILQGKYNDGLAVLPWTLTGCVWYGLFALAQNYLWCAEKSRLATLPLAIGLVVNIGLNLALLPIWGLYGAVTATAISTFVCLAAILLLSHRHGLPLDLGTWLLSAVPIALAFGTWTAVGVLAVLLSAAGSTTVIFNSNEQLQLRQLISDTFAKLKPSVAHGASAPSNV